MSELKAANVNEQHRLYRAKKVTEADYPASLPIGCPVGFDYGEYDGWFPDIDSLREYCEDNDAPLPAWVFGGFWRPFRLNAENIVENECESGEHHDDMLENIGDEPVKRLQSLLDEWCATLPGGTSTGEIDHSTVVILSSA
jgi:hypothetical protein